MVQEPVVHESPTRIIRSILKIGSTIHTNDYIPYRLLDKERYLHEVVNHD